VEEQREREKERNRLPTQWEACWGLDPRTLRS